MYVCVCAEGDKVRAASPFSFTAAFPLLFTARFQNNLLVFFSLCEVCSCQGSQADANRQKWPLNNICIIIRKQRCYGPGSVALLHPGK